jgi:hypothetical protein
VRAKETRIKPQWAQEKQPDPPNFGQAKRIPRWLLNWVIRRRRPKTSEIIRNGKAYCDFEEGLISLVVLSCKRLPELKRLCESMIAFFQEVGDYPKIERILVDNGSGHELLDYAQGLNFFDRVIAHPENLGMAVALNDAYPKCHGEYILLIEEDFVLEYSVPFLQRCLDIFSEYPEIGIIRLKNQNNWWKPFRIIGPLRATSDGTEFWTWLPSLNGRLNVWAAGSVLFRKVSFFSTGSIPIGPNVSRDQRLHQGYLYECVYGRQYNKTWLAAKVKDCYPFVQPNDNPDSSGWGEVE